VKVYFKKECILFSLGGTIPTYKGLKYKKYSTEEKLAIVRRYLNDHESMRELEQKTGISNGQISNWVRRYQQEGQKGL
jgi:transposase-like protein